MNSGRNAKAKKIKNAISEMLYKAVYNTTLSFPFSKLPLSVNRLKYSPFYYQDTWIPLYPFNK